MNVRSEQFLILEGMRKAAGVTHSAWARKAGILWVPFLKILVDGEPPTRQQLANLQRALEELAGVHA